MKNPDCVRCRKAVRHAYQQLNRFPPRPPLTRPIAHGSTRNQLRHDVRASVTIADIVNNQDMRVVQRRRHLRFAAKPTYSRAKELEQEFWISTAVGRRGCGKV